MEQLELKHFQARMLRTCTQIAQQQFFAQERAAEMEEFSDADTAAEVEEAENTEFNEVTE